MSTTTIVIIVVVAVIVLAATTVLLMYFNRRRALHRRYGPEYDHAVEEAGSVRAGEADLRERLEAHDKLPIRPLTTDQADRYRREWQQVQGEFVDTPSGSLRHADVVVTAMMTDRGYPMADFDQQAKLVSVDYPSVADNYRLAHATFLENERVSVATDQIRTAIVAYRSLFEELLDDDSQEVTTSAEQRPTRRAS